MSETALRLFRQFYTAYPGLLRFKPKESLKFLPGFEDAIHQSVTVELRKKDGKDRNPEMIKKLSFTHIVELIPLL